MMALFQYVLLDDFWESSLSLLAALAATLAHNNQKIMSFSFSPMDTFPLLFPFGLRDGALTQSCFHG
jgi:hypothetical protein